MGMGQVAMRMAQAAPGCQRLTYLTLISICSSISLFLMAAYSFSSLLGTWGQAGTRGQGPDPLALHPTAARGDPTQAQEPIAPSHLFIFLGLYLTWKALRMSLSGQLSNWCGITFWKYCGCGNGP